MELKYVGDMPRVSKNGVGFDSTKPDKYIYLHAALELLEALSYGATETTQHLYKSQHKELKPQELLAGLKKYVKNLDAVYAARVQKAKAFVDELKERVQQNDSLNDDEKRAWLNNIDIMKEYYLQYITNQSVYEAALEALADEIAEAKVKEVTIPMFRNYGVVLHDLQKILEQRKSPIDTDLEIKSTGEGIVGTMYFHHY
jgi:Na+/phosphate symporter